MMRSVVTVGAEVFLGGVARLLPWEHGRLGAETASSVAEAVTETRTSAFSRGARAEHDHRALELGTAELAAFDLRDVPRLQALLYGLHTLLIAHMNKEDEIVFPMLEQLKIEPAGLQQRVAAIPPPWDVRLHD